MRTFLSKSKYTTYCLCPKALWLKTYDPDKAVPVDEGTMARFAAGNEVGDLAMGIFGDFVEVTTLKEDGSLDLKAMVDKTNECIQGLQALSADTVPVFAALDRKGRWRTKAYRVSG